MKGRSRDDDGSLGSEKSKYKIDDDERFPHNHNRSLIVYCVLFVAVVQMDERRRGREAKDEDEGEGVSVLQVLDAGAGGRKMRTIR